MNPVQRVAHRRFERGMRYIELRLRGAPAYKWMLRYLFPDHWSFLIGEIALYAFGLATTIRSRSPRSE